MSELELPTVLFLCEDVRLTRAEIGRRVRELWPAWVPPWVPQGEQLRSAISVRETGKVSPHGEPLRLRAGLMAQGAPA